MVIEAGKLIPATAHDAERLDTYRRGTKVSVRFTEEKDRVLVRKWFAIIGKAVKECQTPWQTKDQASEAIKLSLGIVNLSKTVSGAFMQYPKSLTELTDPELEEAVEQMTAIIQHITGVDPADWRKEIADLGEDENTQTSDENAPSTDAGSDAVPTGVAPDLPAKADQPDEDMEPSATSSSGPTILSAEDRRNLLDLLKRLKASIGDDETVVHATGVGFAAEGRKLSPLAADKASTLVKLFRAVCRGERALAEVVREACGIAQVDELELGMNL
jgi:hypothetical protein